MMNILELCHFVVGGASKPIRPKSNVSYNTTNYSYKNTLDQLLHCLQDKETKPIERDDYNRDVPIYENEDIKEELIKKNFRRIVKSNKYTNEIIMQLCSILESNIFVLTNDSILKIFYTENELYLDKKNMVIAINTDNRTSETHIQRITIRDVDLRAFMTEKMVFVMGDKKLRFATDGYVKKEVDELVSLVDSLWF